MSERQRKGEISIEVRELTKQYRTRRGTVIALDGVDFDVFRGDVVGLLGPNGAGKTTTIKCLCNLVRPTSGSIRINGKSPEVTSSEISVVLEGNRNIYWRLTPEENLEFFAGIQGLSRRSVDRRIKHLLEQFDLTEKAKVPVRTLSKGMQQKTAVAAALVTDAPILFLDEPTLGLDVESAFDFVESVKTTMRDGSRTILLSSHDMDLVQRLCDRVVVINRGKVVVDEDIPNLLALFESRAYRFTLLGRLNEKQVSQLRKRFPMLEVQNHRFQTHLDVELPGGDGFYDVTRTLEGTETIVQSIVRQDPDLEQIYLRIIKAESKN